MRLMGVSEQEFDNTDISTVVRQIQYYDIEQQKQANDLTNG